MLPSTKTLNNEMPETQPPLSDDQVKEEEEKEELVIMPSLPEDIMDEILSLLPVKSILRFRCVSKHWCNKLSKDSSFVKYHLDRAIRNDRFNLLLRKSQCRSSACYSSLLSLVHTEPAIEIDSPLYPTFEDERDLIHGSVNGLILMCNPWEDGEGVILWNPSTKEIKEVPGPVNVGVVHYVYPSDTIDYDSGSDLSEYIGYGSEECGGGDCYEYEVHTVCGFGYSHVIDDYKIVVAKISYTRADKICCGCEVMVHSLRSNSWITLPDTIPYDLHLGYKTKSVILNGDPHWIGSSCANLTKEQESSFASSIVIVSFDVEHNIFREVPVIQELQESVYGYKSAPVSTDIFMGTFSGCLSVVQGGELDLQKNNDDRITIWVMKEYGVMESWTKMFCITKQLIERSINYSKMTVKDFKNGMVMFNKDNSSLVLYDVKHEVASVVNNLSEDWIYIEMYVESLVSLNSGVYLGQGELANREFEELGFYL